MNPKMISEKRKDNPGFSADENGFIEPSKIHQTPDLEIYFLGGSTTACLLVEDTFRFPYLTGRFLEKKTNLTINTYNAGRSGNDAIDSYNRLLNVIIPTKPQYVILMHAINDVVNFLYTGSYWSDSNPYRTKTFYVKNIEENEGLNSYNPNRNGVFPNTQLALQKFTNRLTKKTEPADEWKSIKGSIIKINTVQFYQDFESALQTFVHTCKIWDVEPILMTQGNRLSMKDGSAIYNQLGLLKKSEKRISTQEFKLIYNKTNDIIRKVANKNQLLLIDLDQSIPKEEKYMYDEVHLTFEGSILVANIISNQLLTHVTNVQNKKGDQGE